MPWSQRLIREEHRARRFQKSGHEHPVHEALAEGKQPRIDRRDAYFMRLVIEFGLILHVINFE